MPVSPLLMETHESSVSVMQVTAVGSAVLYVRADVHRQGVLFTVGNLVGASWDADGWDGLESEGLCWLARQAGFMCWGMPHTVVLHDEPP